jgi:hypothetical protein
MMRLYCFFFVYVSALLCAPTGADDRSSREQPRLFTNQDIGHHEIPPEENTPKNILPADRDEKKNQRQRLIEEHEMGYWCKKASAYRERIDYADGAVKEIEEEISEEGRKSSRSSKQTAQLQKKLEQAKKLFRGSEADLDELEQEAHRRGVNPGWLRCQL